MTNASNTAALADAYAALKYEEKNIAARIDALKAEIISVGDAELVGDTCVVALVEKKGAETLDKAAALALLKSLGATPERDCCFDQDRQAFNGSADQAKTGARCLMDGASAPPLPLVLWRLI
jgi:hypothetical protein